MEHIDLIKLKSHFIDILDETQDLSHFEYLLEKMTMGVNRFFRVQDIHFYIDPEWKEQLLVAGIRMIETSIVSVAHDCLNLTTNSESSETESFNVQILVKNGDTTFGKIVGVCHKDYLIPLILHNDIGQVCGKFLKNTQNLSTITMREQRYRQLFRVTEQFHSTMDMNDVLEKVIKILQEFYPNFTYSIFLTQDSERFGHLPIFSLQSDGENLALMQAYVTSTVQIEAETLGKNSIVYAPLKGKQGVYGVLQIVALNGFVFPKYEVDFISLLANTAGNALENAQLYQQSQQLVADLKLINEVSH